MKKLMFTLALVALSGSSFFGVQGKFIAPEYQKCLQEAGKIQDKGERDKAIQKCQKDISNGPESSGEGKAGVTRYDNPDIQACLAEKGRTALEECEAEAASR